MVKSELAFVNLRRSSPARTVGYFYFIIHQVPYSWGFLICMMFLCRKCYNILLSYNQIYLFLENASLNFVVPGLTSSVSYSNTAFEVCLFSTSKIPNQIESCTTC
jgi:hypothetical protein